MIDQKSVDAAVPPPEQILTLIVRTEQHKKMIWTAGRVLKEAALWRQVRRLEYQERKLVLKRVKISLDALAAQGILRHRAERQSIGYGYEVGFDYITGTPPGQ